MDQLKPHRLQMHVGWKKFKRQLKFFRFCMLSDELRQKLRDRLDLFFFFHLGSDAHLEIEEAPEQVQVRIEHRRVEPFELAIPYERVPSLLSHPRELEQLLLDQLNSHRR